MKNISDIEKLSYIHPAIELGLNAILLGVTSKEEALTEIVYHLAINLEFYKNEKTSSLAITTGQEQLEEANPIHLSSEEKIGLQRILDSMISVQYVTSASPDQEEIKINENIKPRIADRVVKKNRGWRW